VNQPADGAAKTKAKASAIPAVSLYHLGDDLGEKNNAAAREPERVKRLQAMLAAWRKDVGAE
jgi:hypothetical protein